MDDIIICSASFVEHLFSLTSVFDKLREAGIQLKVSKCIFTCAEVDFLGYHLSSEGIKPHERLISAVNSSKDPNPREN